MPVPVTAVVASLLAFLYLGLAARVIQLRYRRRTSLGDGGHEDLRQAIRGHGNFSEYAPIFLVLLLAGELQGLGVPVLGFLGALFVLGRALHGYCFAFTAMNFALRRHGMVLTVAAIALMALADLASLVVRF